MTAYLVVAAVGVGSYLLRVSMLVLTAHSGGVPPVIERAARYAIPISFAALATDAFVPHLALARSAIAPAASVIVALVAVRRTRSPHAALICGMPTLWILSAFFGA